MSNNANYDVGVFYMPMWNYVNGDYSNWRLIDNFDQFLVNNSQANRARIPANIYYPSPQWYDENMASVTSSQLSLMRDHEIDFVVFNSYWEYNATNGAYGHYYNHVLDNIINDQVQFPDGMKFALMWSGDFTKMITANGCDAFFQSGGGLDQMLDYWKQLLAKDKYPNNIYKTIDVVENGVTVTKKVFYIYYPSVDTNGDTGTTDSIEGICGYCENNSFFAPLGNAQYEPYINNNKTQYLLDYIESYLNEGPLYFVAVITPYIRHDYNEGVNKDYEIKYDWLLNHPQLSGYSAVTSYGYKYFQYEDEYDHSNYNLPACNGHNWNFIWKYDYSKLQSTYQQFYNYMLNSTNHSNSTFDYQVPVSAGFNRGPFNKAYKEAAQSRLNTYPYQYSQDQYNEDVKTVNNLVFADSCNDYAADPSELAFSTPATFQQSLQNAKNFADANPGKTKGTIMISAWNEYAEGTLLNQHIPGVPNTSMLLKLFFNSIISLEKQPLCRPCRELTVRPAFYAYANL